MIAPLHQGMTRWRASISRIFDARIEESWRLRILGLAFLWLATLGLVWTGGSPWLGLVGALGTLGHWLSWRWRHQPSKLRSILVALLVVALSFSMRSQVLEAFEGNWLPMARFLLIVQALSSFDLRTRGGLYTSMALGGTVLFFAGQQSFNPKLRLSRGGLRGCSAFLPHLGIFGGWHQGRPSPLVEPLARTAGHVALLDSRRLRCFHPGHPVLLADAAWRSRTHWTGPGINYALLRRHLGGYLIPV